MLKSAVADAQSGKRVGIYAYSYAYASQLCVQAVRMGAPKGSVVPFTRQSDRSNLMAVDVVWYDHYTGAA